MKNFEWCVYTYKHRIAFAYVAKKLIKNPVLLEKIMERQKYHDLDKVLLYLFLDFETCVDYHVHHQPHHLECNVPKTYEDLVETIIDYECAPYTKPDKPLNAFDFVHKLIEWNYIDKQLANSLFDIMHDLGIDSSYNIMADPENMKLLQSIGEVTEEMILLEVMEYVRTNPSKEFDFIKQKGITSCYLP